MPTALHSELESDHFHHDAHSGGIFEEYPRNSNESHFDHHEINHYHLSFYFEIAVEFINSLAGVLVLMAVILAGINLIIVGVNSMTGSDYGMFNPLHSTDKASILRIRLMLGEQTALALALLVAADVLDTVIKPSHAYEMNDVIKMGFLTVLRTGLAYFLAREIKELETGGTVISSHGLHGKTGNHFEEDGIQYLKNGSTKSYARLLRKNESMKSMQSNTSGRSHSSSRWVDHSDATTSSNHSNQSNGLDDPYVSTQEREFSDERVDINMDDRQFSDNSTARSRSMSSLQEGVSCKSSKFVREGDSSGLLRSRHNNSSRKSRPKESSESSNKFVKGE